VCVWCACVGPMCVYCTLIVFLNLSAYAFARGRHRNEVHVINVLLIAFMFLSTGLSHRSLSDQVSETATKTLLQLELENKRLLRKLQVQNGSSEHREKNGVDDKKFNEDSIAQNGTIENAYEHAQDQLTNNIDSRVQMTSSRRSRDVIDGTLVNNQPPVIVENGSHVRAVNRISTAMNGSTTDEVNDHLEEISQLRSVISGLQVQRDRYDDNDRRSANIEMENAQLRRRLETVEKAAHRCDELEQTVTRLTFELEVQRRAASRVSDLTATVTESEIEIDGLRRLVAELRSSVESSQMDADRAGSELDELIADRDKLKRHADVIASRTADLQRRCDELSSENARLRRSGDTMTDAARRLEKRIEELTGDVEAASVEKAALIDRIGELEEEYQSTGEVAEMRCRSAEQRVEELERRIEEMTRERNVDRSLVTRLRQVTHYQ